MTANELVWAAEQTSVDNWPWTVERRSRPTRICVVGDLPVAVWPRRRTRRCGLASGVSRSVVAKDRRDLHR